MKTEIIDPNEPIWKQRIRMVVNEHGGNRKAVSKGAGRSDTWIRDILLRDTTPLSESLQGLADFSKKPVSWFFGEEELPEDSPKTLKIPVISWVSAGALMGDNFREEQHALQTIAQAGLPDGDWIGLIVEGSSMNRVSPPGSIILVNRKEKSLALNGLYVIDDGTGKATYKRYRSPPQRFEPVSDDANHEPIYFDNEPTIIGRVRRTILDH